MAYPAGNGGLRSPREESFAFRNAVGAQIGPSSDGRGQLHRRFTTNNIPTLSTPLSPIGQQRRQAAEPAEFTTATYHKLQVLEKKKLEYEYLKEQRRRFEAEMELIDLQSRRGEEEIHRLSTDLRYGKQPAHSQPTTPPEYNESNGFPTAFSRPNRFSMSSINPSMTTPRGSRANSQVTAPPASFLGNGGLPSQSMPGSRRNSDEDNDDFENDDFTPISPVSRRYIHPKTSVPHSSTCKPPPPTMTQIDLERNNRMSMPVTSLDMRGRDNLPDLASVLGHIDTTAYLFGEDDKEPNPVASPDRQAYLQMSNTDDRFPILVRRDGAGNASRAEEYDMAQTNGNVDSTPNRNANNNRRSVEFTFSPESKRSSFTSTTNGMPKLTQSYSTSDVPTLANGAAVDGTNGSGFNTHAEQHLQNHNATLGRVPPSAFSNRHSREVSSGFSNQEYRPAQSGLHASAPSFGPAVTSAVSMNGLVGTVASPTMSQYSTAQGPPTPYYGYGMSALNGAMNGMSLGPGPQMNGGQGYGANGMYGPVQYINPYATFPTNGRVQDSQARVIQSRRLQNDTNRFMNYDLKTMPRHEIYTLCKDQHGCRFLQKKLEERNEEHIQIIFDETAPHVIELMTDPFGNYLCQKLLEFTNDEQRNTLVRNAIPAMVSIALNQHGTRALQKMIEHISTEEQTQMIIQALSGQVVDLIQDLNGNHVIQKCLNHLKSSEAQFIFDAVGEHCIVVGTHRHGCCVLQRCIDHASGFQKVDLVRKITAHSFHLVQDPFGNYVIQYILDLNDPAFTTPMCAGFQGQIIELSKQKFSSNVIEKCIRCAEMPAKEKMIEELLDAEELEILMRDSYGNYVVQTALEFAPSDLCMHLIEIMRPILPAIRQTPYGRRIQSKVQDREGRLAAYTGRTPSGHVSPQNGLTSQGGESARNFTNHGPGAAPYRPNGAWRSNGVHHNTGGYQPNGTSSYQAPPMYTATANYGHNIASPQPHRLSNPPLPNQLHNSVHNQAYQQYGIAQNGMGNFF